MKNCCLFLIFLAIMPFKVCFGQEKEIEVRLSLVDKYVRMELTNHTAEDLYIPHLHSFFSIWDENEVELTNAYMQHLFGAFADSDKSRPLKAFFSKEFTDEHYDAQQRIYFQEALEKEKEIFLKLNPLFNEKEILKSYRIGFDRNLQTFYMIFKQDVLAIPSGYPLNIFDAKKMIALDQTRESITEKKMFKEYKISFKRFLEFLYLLGKYDGIAIKTGQTLNIFKPIFGLFENDSFNSRERLTIRFTRHNDWDYSVFDTVTTFDGYRIYTPLPEVNAGYKLYDGTIDCNDEIIVNPSSH